MADSTEPKGNAYFLPPLGDRRFHFEDKQVMDALVGTDYLRSVVEGKLHHLTSGEKWSLYRAIAMLAEPALNVVMEQRLQRLTDLVRYMRHELLNEGLISQDEYTALVIDSDNGQRVARLEGYDAAIKAITQNAG